MNYKPILFSGEMVRAILDGRKNQTRRVTKDQNLVFTLDGITHLNPNMSPIKCPYGQVGDRLWVRETWKRVPTMVGENPWSFIYKATDPSETNWKPSIHMPREASRIILEITEIRVERLQDISKEDAIAEGIKTKSGYAMTLPKRHQDYFWNYLGEPNWSNSPIDSFRTLWDSINGKKHPWESNPWVWVIKFKNLSPEEA